MNLPMPENDFKQLMNEKFKHIAETVKLENQLLLSQVRNENKNILDKIDSLIESNEALARKVGTIEKETTAWRWVQRKPVRMAVIIAWVVIYIFPESKTAMFDFIKWIKLL